MGYDGKVVIESELSGKGFEQGVGNLGNILKGAAIVGSVAAIAKGVQDIVGSVMQSGMAFEERLSGVKAVSGATAEEMAKLTDAAMQAGRDTVFSAASSAQAIEELMKAGLNTEQILGGGLTGALNLAAAGELDLASAAEIASTALNAFKADGLSMADAANLLAGAANASATDVMGLKLGLSQVSAVASGAGMTFRDTATALALFAQNGLKGSDSGTSLKTMLLNLQPQTSAQIALFQQLGIVTEDGTNKFFDETGSLRSLAEVSGVLKTALQGMSDQQRSATLETMFGTDALRAANILYKEGAQGVDNMYAAMSKVTAADVAAERLNNLSGSIEFMKGSLETIAIQIYNQFQGPLNDAVKYITEAVNALSYALDDPKIKAAFQTIGRAIAEAARGLADFAVGVIPKTIEGVAGLINIIDAFSPVLITAGAAFLAYKGYMLVTKSAEIALTAAQWALNAAMAANPVGVFVAILAGAAVGVAALTSKMREASSEAQAFADENAKLVKSIEDLKSANDDAAEAYAQKISDMDAEKAATDQLIEKIIALNNVKGRTAEQDQELAASAELLSSRVADANLYYDELTGTLSLTEEELRGVADAQDASRRSAAGVERLNQLYNEQAEAAAKVKELEQARVETAQKFNSVWGGNDKRVYFETLQAQEKALAEAKAAEASYGKKIEQVAGQVEEAKQVEQNAIVKTTEAYKVETAEAKEAAKEKEKAEKEAAEALEAAMKKSYKSAVGYARNAWKDMEQAGAISVRKMIKNLTNNTKDLVEWQKLLKQMVAKGIDEGIIKELEEKGPEAAKQARVLVHASDKEISKLNKAYRKATKAATAAVQEEFSDPSFTGSGAKGVKVLDGKMDKAVENADFTETGEGIAQDVKDGVESKASAVEGATEQTVKDAKRSAARQIITSNFEVIGKLIDAAVARGIRNGTGTVQAAIMQMAEEALAAAKKTLQIASPSKRAEHEIADPMIGGIVKPFKDSRAVEATVSGFLDNVVSAARVQSMTASRSSTFGAMAFATAGGAGGRSFDFDTLIRKLQDAGIGTGDTILDGEVIGRKVAPVIRKNLGEAVTATGRSGYRGK